jgi:hypothetical protein
MNKWDCGGTEGVTYCVVLICIVAYELIPYTYKLILRCELCAQIVYADS